MFVLAHGNWIHDLVFAVPALVLVVWLGLGSLRDRRAAARSEGEDGARPVQRGHERVDV